MTWCIDDDATAIVRKSSPAPAPAPPTSDHTVVNNESPKHNRVKSCPSCGHQIKWQEKGGIHNLPGLPAGVKFDPSDQELLEHLEAKVRSYTRKLHPLIDEFIPTLEGENGICYAHPQKLPGVSKDGFIRHFFHRPSKAYTTGTRKRRKVHADIDGDETRWHKTGKTRAVFTDQGKVIKGYKKILVLYTNYGKQRKPEKTNWVMHQYHLGNNDDEKDGELVVSKIFFQTQPRQCSSSTTSATKSRPSAAILPKDTVAVNTNTPANGGGSSLNNTSTMFVDYYNQSLISFKQTTS